MKGNGLKAKQLATLGEEIFLISTTSIEKTPFQVDEFEEK